MPRTAGQVESGLPMQQPDFVAASSEHSDDMLDDDEDDLHLANVNVNKAIFEHQLPELAKGNESAEPDSVLLPATASSQLAAFETITQGLVQGYQAAFGITCATLAKYIKFHYPNVKKVLFTSRQEFIRSLNRLTETGFIQVMTAPPPVGFAKLWYESTQRPGVPVGEITKILAWVEKLAAKPLDKEKAQQEAKWRQKAADAIVLHSVHDMLDWGGVHAKILRLALKDLDRRPLVHCCLVQSMSTIDTVIAHLVQRGCLKKGRGSQVFRPRRKQKDDLDNDQLWCLHPVSLTELESAYSAFDLIMPEHVASAARNAQPESNGHQHDSPPPEATQGEEGPTHSYGALHVSASMGALTGAAAPAYATQMDGPNDVMEAAAATTAAAIAAAAAAATASAAIASAQRDSPLAGFSSGTFLGSHGNPAEPYTLKRGRPDVGCPADAVQTKKAKSGSPALEGLLLAVKEDRGPAPFLPRPSASVQKAAQQHIPTHPFVPPSSSRAASGIASHHPSSTTAATATTEAAAILAGSKGQQIQNPRAESSSMHQGLFNQPQRQAAGRVTPELMQHQAEAPPHSPVLALPPSQMEQSAQRRTPELVKLQAEQQEDAHRVMRQETHPQAEHSAVLLDPMPELTPPCDITWAQRYAAAASKHAVALRQGQGSFLQPPGQGQAAQPHFGVNGLLLPPVLAHQNAHTGHWVPSPIPTNPFGIAWLPQDTDGGSELQSQHTAHTGLRKHGLDNDQAAAGSNKMRTNANSAAAAAAVVCDRWHEQYPAQLANHEQRLDQCQAMPNLARGQAEHTGSYPLPQDLSQQPQGYWQQPQGSWQQPQGSLPQYQQHQGFLQNFHSLWQQHPGPLPQHQGSWQQPQHDTTMPRFQAAAPDLQGHQPISSGHPKAHQANDANQRPAAITWHQQQPPHHGRFSHNLYSGPHAHHFSDLRQQNADGVSEQQQSSGRVADTLQPLAAKGRLHGELMEFAVLASPTEDEQRAIQEAVAAVTSVTKVLWPDSQTVLFGSQATSLALPGSDLDIVVLGVSENITNAASGFTRTQREFLGELLEDLLDGLKTAGMLKGRAKIIDARVPIIKCTLAYGSGLAADISLGAVNGAAAVQYVCQMVSAAPPLRVLVLVIKALLKETMLNEVFTGGLSSYSIVNMVMTHLLCMGYQLTDLSGPIGPGPGFWGSLVPAREQPEEDLGELLLSFFAHFGSNFDYSRHAVSVGQGGVVEKKREWKQAERPWLLAVEDPQQLGKDIGSGTFNIRNVQQLFAAAFGALTDCLSRHTESNQWAAVQADGASSSAAVQSLKNSFPLLSELIVVETAVGRTKAFAKKRQQQAKQAPHQNRLSVLDTHHLLKKHLKLTPAPPHGRPTFRVGKKGKKPAVTLQFPEEQSKKQKKKAKQAREKARAHRPQTRSPDAALVALPINQRDQKHLPPSAPKPKKQKVGKQKKQKANTNAQTAAGNKATGQTMSKKQKQRKKAKAASQAASLGKAVQSGAVQKKKSKSGPSRKQKSRKQKSSA